MAARERVLTVTVVYKVPWNTILTVDGNPNGPPVGVHRHHPWLLGREADDDTMNVTFELDQLHGLAPEAKNAAVKKALADMAGVSLVKSVWEHQFVSSLSQPETDVE